MLKDVANLPDKLDVLIVGAGFSGIFQLHHFRKLGLAVKIVEAGSDIGGTWYWNCYPGARVDSEATMYQLSIEEIWKDWSFSVKFPDWKELRQYFQHADRKLGLRRDVYFDTRVVAAEFDESAHRWVVTTHKGEKIRPRFLSMCTGFASKPYIPDIKGLHSFKGICHHTALWPQDGLELKDKRVGIIGTGASGVQVTEEAAKVAQHLTVFQRTPNFALPMNQTAFDEEMQRKLKERQSEAFRIRRANTSGHDIPFAGPKMSAVSLEERRQIYERLWQKGGFNPTKGGFQDVFFDDESNDWAYGFWRDKVRQRLRSPWLQEKLAPSIKPHPFAVKRPSLERTYYDAFNQPNVNLIDVNENPIVEVTPKGVRTGDGKEHEFDVLVLATGFDALTGSLTQIDFKGVGGISIRDKWSTGVRTHLGLTTAGFPNMFFVYAAHGVTALCNGPTCLVGKDYLLQHQAYHIKHFVQETQSEWIVQCLKYMKENALTRIEATKEAETAWTRRNDELCQKGLWIRAKSWYTGANIPGKRVECLNFSGGLPLYTQLCEECAQKGYEGFTSSCVRESDYTDYSKYPDAAGAKRDSKLPAGQPGPSVIDH